MIKRVCSCSVRTAWLGMRRDCNASSPSRVVVVVVVVGLSFGDKKTEESVTRLRLSSEATWCLRR